MTNHTDLEMARRAAASMPDATLVTFPQQGHLPWLDDSQTHGRHVRQFLRNGRGSDA